MKYIYNKKGMLVIALAAGLCFVLIVFASLAERVRNEAAITNQVSVIERLDQISCAVGRIALRKLQMDIDYQDKFGKAITQKIYDGNSGYIQITGGITDEFSKTINCIDVVQNLIKEYNKTHGSDSNRENKKNIDSIKFAYSIYIEPASSFGEPLPGAECAKYERKGHVDMSVVTQLKNGVKRQYTVRKEFLFTYLLAQPFYRFTLFSPKGASLEDSEANSIEYESDGKIKQRSNGNKQIPLVCVNAVRNPNTESNFNFISYFNNRNGNFKEFYKNGWVYLGGNGKLEDINEEPGNLLLNVVPGMADDEYQENFGEFFHLYYDKSSQGWLVLKDWSDWLMANMENNSNGNCKMVMVEYGLYKGLYDLHPYRNLDPEYYLFNNVKSIYKDSFKKNRDNSNLDKSSSLHLFGTSKYCTPTVVFGKVKSRYLRCLGLFFDDIKRVYPFRSCGTGEEVNRAVLSLPTFYHSALPAGETGMDFNKIREGLEKFLPFDDTSILDKYYNPIDGKVAVGPKIIDHIPYVSVLKNILYPGEPNKAWDLLQDVRSPEELCVEDFNFREGSQLSKEARYKGKIEDMRIDYDEYLKSRTTFTLGNEGEETKISDNFFETHFFKKVEHSWLADKILSLFNFRQDDEVFSLGQIIRVKGNLKIDKTLHVEKGGVIVCDGTITIEKPIYNNFLIKQKNKKNIYHYECSENNPNSFGYLTLVAKKGIEIKTFEPNEGDTLPSVHAFLISGCESGGSDQSLIIHNPLHIIGGVAVDKINDLVKNGSVIEWGFDPADLGVENNSDYYGLTLGPRDIEIYSNGEN